MIKKTSKIKITLEKNVSKIIDILEKNGYEAYAVGGCVRDSIIGKKPYDWDITTNATPDKIKKIFNKTFDTGIKHGTVSVLIDKKTYEVTTYRIDGIYSDFRHPDNISFTSMLKEDLSRRDFTINAMAYSDKDGLVDLFGGLSDIKNKVISCVGDARTRFNEDALRMIRAIRFSAVLGFEIDSTVTTAISELKDNLSYVSIERVNSEFVKLITSKNTNRLSLIYDLDLDKYLFNNLFYLDFKNDNRNLGKLFKLLDNSKADVITRLSILFSYPYNTNNKNNKSLGSKYDKNIKNILKYLKFDNKTINIISKYVYYLNTPIFTGSEEIRYQIRDIGLEYYNEFLDIKEKIIKEFNNNSYNEFLKQRKLSKQIIKNSDPLYIKDLDITGNDIMNLDIKNKSDIGIINNHLLKKILNNPSDNNYKVLIKYAKEYLNSER